MQPTWRDLSHETEVGVVELGAVELVVLDLLGRHRFVWRTVDGDAEWLPEVGRA